jgi:hypothetical protein
MPLSSTSKKCSGLSSAGTRRTQTTSRTRPLSPPPKSAARSDALSFRQSHWSSETSSSPSALERKTSSWQYASPANRPTPRNPRALVPRLLLAPKAVSRSANSDWGRPAPLSLIRTERATGCTLEKGRLATDDPMRRLQNNLHRLQLVPAPLLANVPAVRPVRGLIAHREGPDAHIQLFVKRHVHPHSLEQIRGESWKL